MTLNLETVGKDALKSFINTIPVIKNPIIVSIIIVILIVIIMLTVRSSQHMMSKVVFWSLLAIVCTMIAHDSALVESIKQTPSTVFTDVPENLQTNAVSVPANVQGGGKSSNTSNIQLKLPCIKNAQHNFAVSTSVNTYGDHEQTTNRSPFVQAPKYSRFTSTSARR